MKLNMLIALSICGLLLISGCTQSNNNGKDKDKTPPHDLSIRINEIDNFTTTRAVTLTTDAQDDSGNVERAYSNDGVNWSVWETSSGSKPWNLSEGDGVQTVYFKARDKAGNVAGPVNDTIILDSIVPTVTDTSPKSAATGIQLTSRSILITFSEKMDKSKQFNRPLNLTGGTDDDPYVTDNVWKSDTQLELIFNGNMMSGITYKADFHNSEKQVMDLAGNPARPYVWSFTTRPGPKVLSQTPTGKDADVLTTVTIAFDRAMNYTATERATLITVTPNLHGMVPYNISWSGNTMTVHFKGYLYFSSTYNVTVCSKYKECGEYSQDSEGGRLEKTIKWNFTTRKSKTEVVTYILHHKPGNSYTNVHGLLINNEQFNIQCAYVGLELYDASNKLVTTRAVNLGWQQGSVILKPGQKAPFLAQIGDLDGLIKSVTLRVGSDPAQNELGTGLKPYDGVVVQNYFHSPDPHTCGANGYCITGTVNNTGNESMAHVYVHVIYLDTGGKYIGTWGFDTDPPDVGIGMEANFGIMISDEVADISKIDHCEFLVLAANK